MNYATLYLHVDNTGKGPERMNIMRVWNSPALAKSTNGQLIWLQIHHRKNFTMPHICTATKQTRYVDPVETRAKRLEAPQPLGHCRSFREMTRVKHMCLGFSIKVTFPAMFRVNKYVQLSLTKRYFR